MSESNTGNFIGDFFGAGKGIEKLLDLFKDATGGALKPFMTIKNAEARKKEIILIAEGEAEAEEIRAAARSRAMQLLAEGVRQSSPGTGGIAAEMSGTTINSLPASEKDRLEKAPIQDLIKRSERRELYQNIAKQQNIENVVSIAAEQLQGDEDVCEDPVDPDWTARFFRYSEDVSNEEMQQIWGRVLAGEIKKPGSFSYRALELIRNISSREAQLFSTIANRICRLTSMDYGYIAIDQYKLSPSEQLSLSEAGLFGGSGDALSLNLHQNQTAGIECHGFLLQITNPSNARINIPFTPITSTGRELLPLVTPYVDEEYIKTVAVHYAQKGCQIQYGPILTKKEDGRAHQYKNIAGWLEQFYPAT